VTYASASAASIFISGYSCEGNIIHVPVNRYFSDPLPGNSQKDRVFFSLGNDAKFWLGHFVGNEYAAALFEMYSRGLIAGRTVGNYNKARGLKLVSRIAFGVPISQQNFTDGYYPGILADNYRGAFGEW
jgi:hypothetical protein